MPFMKYFVKPSLLVISLISILILSGCSSRELLVKNPEKNDTSVIQEYNTSTFKHPVALFNPISLNRKVAEQKLLLRTQNVIFIVDNSSKMEGNYRGYSKKGYSSQVYKRFINSMPILGLQGEAYSYTDGRQSGLWGSGSQWADTFASWGSSKNQATETIGKQAFRELNQEFVTEAVTSDGRLVQIKASDLASMLTKLAEELPVPQSPTSLVVITNWDNIDQNSVHAMHLLRQKFSNGSGLCVYTVGVGNTYSRTRFDQVDQCGHSVSADRIAQPREMSHFVERILFYGPADSDDDGIYDFLDKCPNSKKGRIMKFDGCYRFESM